MVSEEYNKSRTCNDKRSLCHAPSYSMHFAKNGLVSACSFTRFMPQGKYPDQTIHDIWFGPNAKSIQKSMKKKEFPAGCTACSSDAYAGNYSQMRLKLYEQYARTPWNKLLNKTKNKLSSGHYSEYPSVMSFELSNTCNLECVMCLGLLSSSIRKNREKLPPLPQVYDEKFLPQIRSFIPHLQEAKFFGGEPFLIDLYLDIWEMFVELNPKCKIYITTNGTILNNRVKSVLEKLPNFQMVVSLDSIKKETYERIRVNASYEKVMENIQYFSEVSKKHNRHLIISPTYMIYNWEEYPEIMDFANRNDILFETNILLTPAHLSLSNFNPEQLTKVIDRWTNYSPFKSHNSSLMELNQKEFDKALSQVKFMLEEQKKFYSNEIGKEISVFIPENKMEFCLFTIIRNSLKASIDPALPLKLLELWKEPNLIDLFLHSLVKIGEKIYLKKDLVENVDIYSSFLNKNFDQEAKTKMLQRLLNNSSDTLRFIEYFTNKEFTNACEILKHHAETVESRIPIEADFF